MLALGLVCVCVCVITLRNNLSIFILLTGVFCFVLFFSQSGDWIFFSASKEMTICSFYVDIVLNVNEFLVLNHLCNHGIDCTWSCVFCSIYYWHPWDNFYLEFFLQYLWEIRIWFSCIVCNLNHLSINWKFTSKHLIWKFSFVLYVCIF